MKMKKHPREIHMAGGCVVPSSASNAMSGPASTVAAIPATSAPT